MEKAPRSAPKGTAYLFSDYRARKKGLDADHVFGLAIWVIVIGLASAKLLYYIATIDEIIHLKSKPVSQINIPQNRPLSKGLFLLFSQPMPPYTIPRINTNTAKGT